MKDTPRSFYFIRFKNGLPDFVGPLGISEAKQKLEKRDLNWTDFLYYEGWWKRVFEIPEFKILLPDLPEKAFLKQAEARIEQTQPRTEPPGPVENPAPSATMAEGPWFLQFEGSEFGPLTPVELGVVLGSGKLRGKLYVWKEGLENWQEVQTQTDFDSLLKQGLAKGAKRPDSHIFKKAPDHEGRKDARISLIATVWEISNRKSPRPIGICADISTSGIQITMSQDTSLTPGAPLQLEIRPASTRQVQNFEVSGHVVWVRPENRRAGIKFVRTPEALKRIIQPTSP